MLYIGTVLMYIFNQIFGNSKYFRPLMFVFLFILLAGSYGTYDTMIFYDRYNNYLAFTSYTEPGFTFIVELFHKIGFNDRLFMILLSLFELVVLFRFLNKYCINHTIFWGLFLIYPMLMFFTQLRFLLGFTIILGGSIPALIDKGKLWVVRYLVFLLIAYTIHSSSIVFIIFLIVNFIDIKKSIVISIVVSLLLFSVKYFNIIINLFGSFLNTEKVNIVLNEVSRAEGNFGRCIIATIMSLGMAGLLFLVKYKVFGDYVYEQQKISLDLIIKIDVLAFIFVPMILNFSVGFYRISQAILLINYAVIANNIRVSSKHKITYRGAMLNLTVLTIAFLLYISFFRSEEMQLLLQIPFFEDNWIINSIFG